MDDSLPVLDDINKQVTQAMVKLMRSLTGCFRMY
jgi:hypothetical protein